MQVCNSNSDATLCQTTLCDVIYKYIHPITNDTMQETQNVV